MLSEYDRNIEYLMVKFKKAYCSNSDNFSNVPQPSHHHDQGFCFVLFFFGGGEEVDIKKIFGAMQQREKYFSGLLVGSGACSPESFEKVVFRIS